MIETWLQQFEACWKNKDIEGIISLFTNDVEYWETPFKSLRSIDEVQSEWSAILNQFDIRLSTSVYSTQDNRFTVKWNLFYTNESHEEKHWSGIYLIELDENSKCTYFYQIGETNG